MKTLLLILVAFLFFNGCSQENEKAVNKNIRLISLSPNETEIIFELGAGKNLIAVSDFCNYPLAAKQKMRIGGLLDPNIERIVSLRPTYIFGTPAHIQLNHDLQKFGLQVTMLPNETINDVFSTIDSIGAVIHKNKSAMQLVENLRDSLKIIAESVQTEMPVQGMLVIGREKGTLRNIMVAGPGTFLNEIWNLTGGENVYGDLQQRYASVSLESIIDRQPRVIIEFETNDPPQIKRIASKNDWQALKNVPAVMEGNIFVISGSYTLIPGPRLVHLARDFASVIKKIK